MNFFIIIPKELGRRNRTKNRFCWRCNAYIIQTTKRPRSNYGETTSTACRGSLREILSCRLISGYYVSICRFSGHIRTGQLMIEGVWSGRMIERITWVVFDVTGWIHLTPCSKRLAWISWQYGIPFTYKISDWHVLTRIFDSVQPVIPDCTNDNGNIKSLPVSKS